ncbi:PAS domain-containing protein, partial [Streptomyces sp. NPDC003233]
MNDGVDYAGVFQALPGMVALLTPDLLFADANEEFLRQSGRTREQVVGRYLFDVFPENPNDPGASGMRNLAASLTRAQPCVGKALVPAHRFRQAATHGLDAPALHTDR